MTNPNSFIGRGSSNQQTGRFESVRLELGDAGEITPKKIATEYYEDQSQTIVSQNNSPDLHFNFSLNPYRGCSHGCAYCYARPTHEYLGWGPGIDFESKIVVKRNAGQLFRNWLAKLRPNQVEPVMMSGVTDCYQIAERDLKITRDCLEAALEFQHPIQITTKNSLIVRDLDILTELARNRLVDVAISITSLDQSLTKIMEPRTSSPISRLEAMATLSRAGIPVTASVSPIIPAINDQEIPRLLQQIHRHGARYAFYIMLRLPITVKDVFIDWLEKHFPDRKEKVLSRIQAMRNGQLSSSAFGERMTGTGVWAEQIGKLFVTFAKKYSLDTKPDPLRTDLFRQLNNNGEQQLELF